MRSTAASSDRSALRPPAGRARFVALALAGAFAALPAAAADPAACLAERNGPCLIAEVLAAAGRVPVDFWRAHTLVEIARLQAEAGEAAGARGTLALARATWTFMAERQPPSEQEPLSDRDFIASEIVKVQATLGDLAAAQATAGAMASASFRELLVDPEIGKAQARAGDFAGALAAAERLDPGEARDEVLVEIARALVAAGDLDGALSAMSRGALAINSIVWNLVAQGRLEDARNVAGRTADAEERAALRATIAKSQALRGDLIGAEATAATIEHPFWRSSAELYIARIAR